MDVAVLIPCFNEEKTIAKVVADFKEYLPQARIIVLNNNSTDKSAELAFNAGAEIILIKQKGKGSTIRKAVDLIKADVYVMVDGDDTYLAKDVLKLMKPVVDDDIDMVIGRRVKLSKTAMKEVNGLGNIMFSLLISILAKKNLKDVLSGYRVFNSNFLKNVPLLHREFELEVEMTFQSLVKGMRIKEVEVDYKERPAGSKSKLNIFRDGFMILATVVNLFRDLKPLTFFGGIAIVLWLITLVYGLIVYFDNRLANLFDTVALLSLFIVGWLLVVLGFNLHTINRRFSELVYLINRQK